MRTGFSAILASALLFVLFPTPSHADETGRGLVANAVAACIDIYDGADPHAPAGFTQDADGSVRATAGDATLVFAAKLEVDSGDVIGECGVGVNGPASWFALYAVDLRERMQMSSWKVEADMTGVFDGAQKYVLSRFNAELHIVHSLDGLDALVVLYWIE